MDGQTTGATAGGDGGLLLTERIIPVPASVSPQAQAALAMVRPAAAPFPALDDRAGWHAHIAGMNAGMDAMLRPAIMSLPASASLETIAGVPVYVCEPAEIPAGNQGKALVYFHGGGLVLLGGPPVELFGRPHRLAAASTPSTIATRPTTPTRPPSTTASPSIANC